MIKIDLSTEALLTRKTVAEIALCENSCQHDLTPYLIDTELSLECIGHIAANSPDVVIATIDELLRLREEKERLEKEADWLALKAWKKRDSEYIPEREHECLECPFDHDCVKCWREAARRAVEEV